MTFVPTADGRYWAQGDSESRAGYAVAVMFILAVIGAWWAFGNFETASQAAAESAAAASSPTAVPTPAELPQELAVGTAVAVSDQVEEAQFHFERGDTVAFSAWLGQPADVEEVQVALLRLDPSGFAPTGDAQPFPVDPNALAINGTMPASAVLDGAGPGTYLLDVKFPTGDQIGYAAFQVEVSEPESVDYFVGGAQQVLIAAGSHTGVQLDADGNVTQQKEAPLGHGSSAPSTFRAVFGGQPYLFISEGLWAGFFLPESETVSRAPQ